ncbi:hypothetical protein ACAG39_09550 [Caldicellulosiruptoraceae bacterium PP1]
MDDATYKTLAPDIEYGVAPIPSPDGKRVVSWAGAWGVVMPRGAKNKQVSFDFMKYLSTSNGVYTYSEETAHFMSAKKINDSLKWYKEYQYGKVVADLLPSSKCRPPIPKGQLSWDELVTATNNTLYGKGTPKDLLKKVTDKVNTELVYK